MKHSLDVTRFVSTKELDVIVKSFDVRHLNHDISNKNWNLITYDPTINKTDIVTDLLKSDAAHKVVKDYSKNNVYTPEICTHIASAIAAYSRIVIHEYKMFAINCGCNIIYSDTDSIYVDKPLPKDCESVNNKLGGLKLEVSNKSAIFLASKCYAISNKSIKDKILLKGLPKEYSSKLTFDDFNKYLNGKRLTVKYHKPVLKMLNKLMVKSIDTEFSTNFPFNKRLKSYDNTKT